MLALLLAPLLLLLVPLLLMLLTQLLTLLLTLLKLLPHLLLPSNHWLRRKSRPLVGFFLPVLPHQTRLACSSRKRSNLDPAETLFLASDRNLHQFIVTRIA